MLSYEKMENFYKLTVVIQKYKNLLSQTDSGLKAKSINGMPHVIGHDPHFMEDLLIRKEKAIKRLPVLEALRENNLPVVEKTIKEATENCSMSVSLKRKIIFQLRYKQGLEWNEISKCLQINDPRKIILRALERKR